MVRTGLDAERIKLGRDLKLGIDHEGPDRLAGAVLAEIVESNLLGRQTSTPGGSNSRVTDA